MAFKFRWIILFLITFVACATSARDLTAQPGFNLTARLEVADGSLVDCAKALAEIKSCTNEIVLYFANGTIDISPPCCRALKMVTHHCWPGMLTALGFTPAECNILRGYCDAAPSGPASSVSVELPVPDMMNGKV